MSYSQNGEDLIIAEYFKERKGILLDIGANDGITFSNSRLLIEKGWYATLVEPSLAFDKLSELYKDNERVYCERLAVDTERRIEVWYELQDSLLSTKDKALADSRKIPYTTSEMQYVTYDDIPFRFKHYAGYNFINIDAEGSDWGILKQIHLDNVECVCIEFGTNTRFIVNYCSYFGMKLLHKNGENMIFVK
jgi:FkbM family methyltransferase